MTCHAMQNPLILGIACWHLSGSCFHQEFEYEILSIWAKYMYVKTHDWYGMNEFLPELLVKYPAHHANGKIYYFLLALPAKFTYKIHWNIHNMDKHSLPIPKLFHFYTKFIQQNIAWKVIFNLLVFYLRVLQNLHIKYTWTFSMCVNIIHHMYLGLTFLAFKTSPRRLDILF